MLNSKIKNEFRRNRNSRFYQGDIIADISFIVGDPRINTEKDLIQLNYAVILSQDCDLENDYNTRQKPNPKHSSFLHSILLCPAYNAELFYCGDHMQGLKMEKFPAKKINKIKKNDEYKRYHYLSGEENYNLPELTLDFKQYFTIPRNFLYEKRKEIYRASLSELFRERLSQRFSNYLSRIGLPAIHTSDKEV